VLVLFAVFASVAILMLSFVLDVGNWFEHQRHLQVQADAAAFAAATELVQVPCAPNEAETMYKIAGQYGGVASVVAANEATPFTSTTPLYNEQIGGIHQSNVHEEVNKKKYFGQSKEDNTVEEAPCAPGADMVDVKLTETNLPWFFQALNVPFINAHARVSVVTQSTATGVEPVVQSEPEAGRVYFLNDKEDKETDKRANMEAAEVIPTATGLATAPLESLGPSGKGGVIWATAKPVKLPITDRHIGIRVALAGNTTSLASEAEKKPEACLHEYVECFDEAPVEESEPVVPPLVNISGYSAEGTGTVKAPIAHQVTLSTPGSKVACSDGYFTNYPFNKEIPVPLLPEDEACTFTISAEVNYGGATNATDDSTNANGITIKPEVLTKQEIPEGPKIKQEGAMTCPTLNAKKECPGGVWTGTATLTTETHRGTLRFGSSQINLKVTCKKEAKSPCETSTEAEPTGKIEDVQRIFEAGPAGSGRIVGAWVCEAPITTSQCASGGHDANSFEVCENNDGHACTHELNVAVELSGSLEPATKYEAGEGPYRIRYGNGDTHPVDNFVIACPPGNGQAKFKETLEKGCKGKYKANTSDPSCTAVGEPYDCVQFLKTPKVEGEQQYEQDGLTELFIAGISARITKPPAGQYECPNRWENSNAGGVPIIPSGDSRLMQLFVVPFGSYKKTQIEKKESPKVPIKKFATFYVTGWVGKFPVWEKDQCDEKLEKMTAAEKKALEKEGRTYHLDDPPYPERDRELVGHLIKYVTHIGEGTGTLACQANSVNTCETVLSE
jgi:Putative Flp pilus-assembly TadE/G-like